MIIDQKRPPAARLGSSAKFRSRVDVRWLFLLCSWLVRSNTREFQPHRNAHRIKPFRFILPPVEPIVVRPARNPRRHADAFNKRRGTANLSRS
jgi:hypothetical protein